MLRKKDPNKIPVNLACEDGYRRIIIGFVVAGVVAIFCYALLLSMGDKGSWINVVATFAVGVMIGAGAMMSGAVVGFLFGIPRTRQDGKTPATAVGKTPATAETRASAAAESEAWDYKPNTNLEEISDWLTKILVGAGLTQLTAIPHWVWRLAEKVALGLGNTDTAKVMGLGILTYYFFLGLIVSYLATRLMLPGMLRIFELRSERKALDQQVKTLERQATEKKDLLTELDQQVHSTQARLLAQDQLFPLGPMPQVDDKEIHRSFSKAAPESRDTIMQQAINALTQGLRQNKKEDIVRTIPVFEGLIQSDPEGVSPHCHGKLGIALMHKIPPDWTKAQSELTDAISLLGPRKDAGRHEYAAYRAICRINLDQAFNKVEAAPAEPRINKEILADLKSASKADRLALSNTDLELIEKWQNVNGVPEDHEARKLLIIDQ